MWRRVWHVSCKLCVESNCQQTLHLHRKLKLNVVEALKKNAVLFLCFTLKEDAGRYGTAQWKVLVAQSALSGCAFYLCFLSFPCNKVNWLWTLFRWFPLFPTKSIKMPFSITSAASVLPPSPTLPFVPLPICHHGIKKATSVAPWYFRHLDWEISHYPKDALQRTQECMGLVVGDEISFGSSRSWQCCAVWMWAILQYFAWLLKIAPRDRCLQWCVGRAWMEKVDLRALMSEHDLSAHSTFLIAEICVM